MYHALLPVPHFSKSLYLYHFITIIIGVSLKILDLSHPSPTILLLLPNYLKHNVRRESLMKINIKFTFVQVM